MAFYDLSKEERIKTVEHIHSTIFNDLNTSSILNIISFFSDEDSYIRKSAYIVFGRIYFSNENLQSKIILLLKDFLNNSNEKIRQTAINAAGEIGVKKFEAIEELMHVGLFDKHHSVRNAVIGSIKKMGEKNPKPILAFSKVYLNHYNKEIRREICHGIELRGRKHPEDILPLLKELQFDRTTRVRNTLIHVLGQIAYKKGCLEKVLAHFLSWQNEELVNEAVEEIIDVHNRYKNFSHYTQSQAISIIDNWKQTKK